MDKALLLSGAEGIQIKIPLDKRGIVILSRGHNDFTDSLLGFGVRT